jgi:crotonobetainyl-CoA:carnitine CoA-transferase CaiB-like acyl-CoA transferase
MSVTGDPGGDPTRVGIPISDLSAGLYLAVGVLVALHDRERTGVGDGCGPPCSSP